MEAHSYKFNPTSYMSPLYENASCAVAKDNETYYRPINSINWDTNEITTICAKDVTIPSDKTKQMLGSFYNQGWPLSPYLHTFFKSPASIQCDNGQNPILSLKWQSVGGKLEPVYQCPADDSLRFAKTQDFTFEDKDLSGYNYNASADQNNKIFVNQSWLNKNNKVFYCPANWYLGKMSGEQLGMNNGYHNIYHWTCGTIYNDYKNNDDVSFQWRYFNNSGSLCMQIITNIKIMVDPADLSVGNYINEHGQYIDFIFVYNLNTNKMTINVKRSKDSEFIDDTAECYILYEPTQIECNYPLTEISIVQFTFDRSNEDVLEMYEKGTLITKLPLCFTNMSMVQDTNLPKFYAVTWITDDGVCNGERIYTQTFKEDSKLVHPTCSRLGYTATQFVDSENSTNVIIAGTPVTRRLVIRPVFKPVQYVIKFNNDTSDFEYIQCQGTFNTTASLGEVLVDSKIPTCQGDGVIFNGWTDPDKRKAGERSVVGDMMYYPSVTYPDYKLIFTVPDKVKCRTECNARTINRRNPIGALPVPSKPAHTFKGWYYDDSTFTKPVHSTDKLIKDTTVYPKFVETVWTVNFIAPNGATITPVKSMHFNNGKTLQMDFKASLPNYTFTGFYQITDDDVLTTTQAKKSTAVYKDMVFTAVFKDAAGNKIYKKYSEAKAAGEITTNTDDTDTGYIPSDHINGGEDDNNNDDTPAPDATVQQPPANDETTNGGSTSGGSTNTSGSTNNGSQTNASYCPADAGWPKTESGKTASQACPSGYTGNIVRTCENGLWKNEDRTNCTRVDEVVYCPADADFPQTNVGQTAEIACPQGTTGKRTRKCNTDGKWGNEDITKCIKDDKSTTESSTMMYIIIGVVIAVIIVIVLFMGKRGGKTVIVQQPMGFAGM